MPMFYFHVVMADERSKDPEGMHLSDLEAARDEATRAARDIVADKVRGGILPESASFEIADENGTVLDVLPFEHAYSRL
jgi:hypothetical protein